MGIKRGIIQSRGLGDIIIALPIARYYHDVYGDEIVWPVCAEFYSSVVNSVPWVTWVSIETDPQGKFFLETPLRVFAEQGVDEEEALYLYQFLSNRPDLTDPEFFSILKFDQYKYQAAGVPFLHKWRLAECIERDPARERTLEDSLGLKPGDRWAVVSLKGSNFSADIPLDFLNPAAEPIKIIDVDANPTDCIFDWCGILAGAEAVVCVDSAMANLVDGLGIGSADASAPALYWVRRSPWDLTPVQGSLWTYIPTNLAISDPKRVDPAAQTQAMLQQQSKPQPSGSGNSNNSNSAMQSHVPFETNKKNVPTNFMHAVSNKKNGGSSGNLQGAPGGEQQNQPKLNPALDLYKQLGVKF